MPAISSVGSSTSTVAMNASIAASLVSRTQASIVDSMPNQLGRLRRDPSGR